MSQRLQPGLWSQGTPRELLGFSLCWSPEVNSPSTREGIPSNGMMSLPVRVCASRQKLLPVFFCGLLSEGVTRFRVSSCLSWSSQMNPSQVCSASWALVDSTCSQVERAKWRGQGFLCRGYDLQMDGLNSPLPLCLFPFIVWLFYLRHQGLCRIRIDKV